jgi:hypothetical protein
MPIASLRRSTFVAFLTVSCCCSAPGLAESGALDGIRKREDGAGPTHLIWLSGPAPSAVVGRDIVAVIDPLYAAVRLLTIERTNQQDALLKPRMNPLGACSLPIDFFPWRVMQFRDYVLIEGAPSPGKFGHNAKLGDFQTRSFVIRRDFVQVHGEENVRRSGSTIDEKEWDPTKALSCGDYQELPQKLGLNASYTASRRSNRTIILANKPAALAPGYPVTARAESGDKTLLYSARELEPAGSLRAVQISEGVDTADGMIRIRQRVLTFAADDSKPKAEWAFDESYARSKLGMKPLAVLPSSELIAMGYSTETKAFMIQSCGYLNAASSTLSKLCRSENVVPGRSVSDGDRTPQQNANQATPTTEIDQKNSANIIFGRLKNYLEKEWNVDTSKMPGQCRSADGCKVASRGENFVAIRGIRLTRGVFKRTGAPYAQTKTLDDVKRSFAPDTQTAFSSALENVMKGATGTPGNLDDDFSGDVGVDCSALVQIAWGGEADADRLDTDTLQIAKNVSNRCDNRIAKPKDLRSGDAIGLSVKPGGTNHMVLFAAELELDGASLAWLVLESASSCDGVCWSVYDPAFFNGWGIYRAKRRADAPCPVDSPSTNYSSAIPIDPGKWRDRLQAPALPGSR